MVFMSGSVGVRVRSRRNGGLTIVGIISVAAGLFLAREIYIAVSAVPGSAIDYQREFVALSEQSQPEGRDAWPDLDEALDALEDIRAGLDRKLANTAFFILRKPDALDEDFPYSREAYLEASQEMLEQLENEGVWDLLDRIVDSPRAVMDITDREADTLLFTPMPELGAMIQLADALAARMYVSHQAGDDAAVARAFEHGMALSRVAGSQANLISCTISTSIAERVIGELQHEVIERPHSEPALRQMLKALEGRSEWNIQLAFEGQRLMVLDTIQWTHTDNGRLILTQVDELGLGSGSDKFGGWKIVNVASLAYPSKRDTTRIAEKYFDALLDRARLTYVEREATPEPEILQLSFPARQLVLREVLHSLDRAFEIADRHQMMVGGAELALAVELYQVENWRYPSDSNQLVPEFLESLPLDPYASGEPLGYALTPESQHGRAYLVYSIGSDGDDNDGAFDPGSSITPLHQDPGLDVVLNSRREDP